MANGHVHFIGAGGVGVAGVAHIAADLGYQVTGSDAVDSPMLESLRQRGLDVSPTHLESLPGQPDVVVFSSAIPDDNKELAEARRRGIPCLRRGEYLGRLARHFDTVVAVSGSHGKTSTTAMLVHILKNAGKNPGYLVGGQVNGWERSASAGDKKVFVTEVDESDGTQVCTHADFAIVINVEDDHCWGLGGVEKLEQCFEDFAKNAHHVLAWQTETTKRLFDSLPDVSFFQETDIPQGLALPFPGSHWRQNATLAIAVATRLGVSLDLAISALRTFPGVNRRLTFHGKTGDGRGVVIEDYAHHPTELRATLDALREGYPDHALLVIFQPHRYERVKRYGTQFSEILWGVSRTWVVAPFAAWVSDGDGIDPSIIAERIPDGRGVYIQNEPVEIARSVKEYATMVQGPYVIAVIGAGDICRVTDFLLE